MANVLVVGGGIIGVCTAHALVKRGAQVTLIEQAPEIALGASGKAGGLLALDWHGPSTASLSELSYNLHASLAEEYDGATKWQYRTLDTLSISVDVNPSSGKLVKHAEHASWLDPKVLRKTQTLGGKTTTAQVHPYLFTTGLAKIAEGMGARILTSTGLKKLERDAGGKWVATTDSEATPNFGGFSHVVLASGPWTGSLMEKLGLQGASRRAGRITGSRAHSIVLEPPKGVTLPAQALFTSIKTKERGHAEPEIYNRPDNTAYACGPTDDSALPSSPHLVEVDSKATASIRSQIALLSPHFGPEARVTKEQACYLPVGSGDPVLGELRGAGLKGLFIASGHSCWGITNGPGSGHIIAELILDGKAKSADISQLLP